MSNDLTVPISFDVRVDVGAYSANYGSSDPAEIAEWARDAAVFYFAQHLVQSGILAESELSARFSVPIPDL